MTLLLQYISIPADLFAGTDMTEGRRGLRCRTCDPYIEGSIPIMGGKSLVIVQDQEIHNPCIAIHFHSS
jgi:hypothetical protein